MVTWQLTFDSNDPARMARFWASLLGYVPEPPPSGFDSWLAYYQSVVPEENLSGNPDDYIDRLVDPRGEGPKIWFQPVPEKKAVKTRFHFDIYVADRTASMDEIVATVDAKVAELVDLGATIAHVNRVDTETLQRYAVMMRDQEGNEFCVG
ncbi:VOC family protein [Serinicoccus marinus]|uniref:VOC family protein n=1 Tax=Serinicoccus marinus TaxID=247333 RepID=UPI002491895B|nr:VOC family protein [Serinicoccus marinus]